MPPIGSASLAKRIITEVEVGLLIRAAPSKRDRVLLEVLYAGSLRVSEIVGLTWSDVLLHAHGSHAIDRGASLPEVQATLGHSNIATTSGYLHARPGSSSGLHLDPGCFFDEDNAER